MNNIYIILSNGFASLVESILPVDMEKPLTLVAWKWPNGG